MKFEPLPVSNSIFNFFNSLIDSRRVTYLDLESKMIDQENNCTTILELNKSLESADVVFSPSWRDCFLPDFSPSSHTSGGATGEGAWAWEGHGPPKTSMCLPKNTDIFIRGAIKVTMMMITTRFSLLWILDFVKEMVEDLSYNPRSIACAQHNLLCPA